MKTSEYGNRPHGTRFWFQGRTLNAHHHIRKNCTADYGRLARRLSSRAVGLVLGGGGARGLSHIGAMQVMKVDESITTYLIDC